MPRRMPLAADAAAVTRRRHYLPRRLPPMPPRANYADFSYAIFRVDAAMSRADVRCPAFDVLLASAAMP